MAFRRYGIALGVVVLSLAGCSSGSGQQGGDATPRKPGQVVVLAGNGERKDPVDGADASRTALWTKGPLATTPDGSLYAFAEYRAGQRYALVRIGRDGKVKIIAPNRPAPDGLALAADSPHLWFMSRGKNATLTRQTIDGKTSTSYLSPVGGTPGRTFVGADSRPLPKADQRRLGKTWDPTALAIRGDGIPVIATRNGDLYEVISDGRVKPWHPRGYAAAVSKARATANPHKLDLNPTAMVPAGRQGMTVVGQGIVRIPTGNAKAQVTELKVPRDEVRWEWTGAAQLDDGSLILGEVPDREPYAGASRNLLRITPDGLIRDISSSAANTCAYGQTVKSLQISGSLGGPIRRADGTVAITGCGRVFAFRPPPYHQERPYS